MKFCRFRDSLQEILDVVLTVVYPIAGLDGLTLSLRMLHCRFCKIPNTWHLTRRESKSILIEESLACYNLGQKWLAGLRTAMNHINLSQVIREQQLVVPTKADVVRGEVTPNVSNSYISRKLIFAVP